MPGDPLLKVADIVVAGMSALSASLRNPVLPPAQTHTQLLEVVDRLVVAHDQHVVSLTLAAVDRKPLAPWHPGAHLDITLPSGRLRQYSLCGDPADRVSYRIAVRRIPDGGGGSIEVHDELPVGATVTTSGPRNAFPLAVPGYGSPTQRLRFIAGGIGITPILPMLGLAERLGIDWSMIYAGRSRESIPFLDEVARYGDQVAVRTDDRNGIPAADDLLGECQDGTTVYACGPAPMLTLIRDQLIGRDAVELHFERFAAAPVLDGRPFTVTLAATGRTLAVGADETLLSVLRRNDIGARYSCQQGFCGTCRSRVLDGEVEHRDALLTDSERANGMMLVCISRAAGDRLVLDL
jgi:ferredoxin-NADP reductase